jgi:hypothetical protein
MSENGSGHKMVETPDWMPHCHFGFHLVVYTKESQSYRSAVEFIEKIRGESSKRQHEITSNEIDFLLFFYRKIPVDGTASSNSISIDMLIGDVKANKYVELFALTTQDESKMIATHFLHVWATDHWLLKILSAFA